MRTVVVPLLLVALSACAESTSNQGETTTTSARIEARRREVVPPSPPPVMGPMMNSYSPLPTLPEETATIPEPSSPPPGKSTLTVPPTMAQRDKKITESIRKEIAADDTLSPTAKAVQVFTKDRKVILKGQARNESERMNIDSKARMADDVIEVDDRIELVPSP